MTDEHLEAGRVYPPLDQIQRVSVKIATELGNYVYQHDLASLYPEPEDKESFIKEGMYSTDYESFQPRIWDWPAGEC